MTNEFKEKRIAEELAKEAKRRKMEQIDEILETTVAKLENDLAIAKGKIPESRKEHKLTEEQYAEMIKNNVGKTPEEIAEAERKMKEREAIGQAKYEENKRRREKEAQKIEKKLNFYKNFKENRNQVLNLIEFEEQLKEKLKKLQDRKNQIDERKQEVESAKKEHDALTRRLKELGDKSLTSKLSDEERNELDEVRRRVYSDDFREKVKKLNEIDPQEEEKVESNIKNIEILISKTDAVWRSILKGKNWDEIGVILSEGNFTAEKGTAKKIEELGEVSEGNIQNDKGTTITSKGVATISKPVEPTIKEPTQPTSQLPMEIKDFGEEHKILSKIPFLKNFMNNRRMKKMDKMKSMYDSDLAKYNAQKEQYDKEWTEYNTALAEYEKANGGQEKIDTSIVENKTENVSKEIENFKKIAEHGWKESIKIDKMAQIARNKVAKAYVDAQLYGTREYNELLERQIAESGLDEKQLEQAIRQGKENYEKERNKGKEESEQPNVNKEQDQEEKE